MVRIVDRCTAVVILTLTVLATHLARLGAETHSLRPESGLVRVLVQDESGSPAPAARVYVNNKEKILYVLQSDQSGWVNLNLPAGTYTISSTINKPKADYLDRYASSNASLKVTPEETTSVVLVLHQLEDPVSDLSLSALKRMGVAEEVAKYTNN